MLHFVYQSGMDVYTEMASNVPDLIKKLDKRIVSFLKKREQDFFVPMNNSFREMIRLHQQTFQMLDVLQPGTIGLDSNRKTRTIAQVGPHVKSQRLKLTDVCDFLFHKVVTQGVFLGNRDFACL